MLDLLDSSAAKLFHTLMIIIIMIMMLLVSIRPQLFAHSTMRLFMWHQDEKAMASCLLRLLSEYDSLSG